MSKKTAVIISLVLAIIALFMVFKSISDPNCCSAKNVGLKTVNSQLFQNELTDKSVVLLDVRTKEEFDAGHIKGAINNDYYQTQAFDSFINSLDKSKKYLIYCRTGHRSGLVLQMMKEKGFNNVTNLEGGINAWSSTGLPTVR